MEPSDRFTPVPFQIVSEPQQLKAFADPLRNRVLHILTEREATNQQLARLLGEPQAKVLYHVRFLVDAGLIRLIEERVRGGNVEKIYRATARLYGLRPDPDAAPSITGTIFEAITQEIVASETLYPDQGLNWELRRVRLRPERVEAFRGRLNALIAEYWGGPDREAIEDPDGRVMSFAAVTYRSPSQEER